MNSSQENLNYQPIPSDYYNFLNDDDDDGNNITGTHVDGALTENEGEEYLVVPNYEYIDDEKITDDDSVFASAIEPLLNKMLEI